MTGLFKRLFGAAPSASECTGEASSLVAQSQLQALRLELAERDRSIDQLQNEMRRLRDRDREQREEATRAQLERLMLAAATPVVQLLAQKHLMEAENKPVQARDVLAVARRLVRTLEDEGLGIEGAVGDRVVFDPNRHEPISTESRLEPGQFAVLRFTGLSFGGRCLRKAGVSPEF